MGWPRVKIQKAGLFLLLLLQGTPRDEAETLQIKRVLLKDQRTCHVDGTLRDLQALHVLQNSNIDPKLPRKGLKLVNSLSKLISLKLCFVGPLFRRRLDQLSRCVWLHKISASRDWRWLMQFETRVHDLHSRRGCVLESLALMLRVLREVSVVLSHAWNSSKRWANALWPHGFVTSCWDYIWSAFLWRMKFIKRLFESLERYDYNCYIV